MKFSAAVKLERAAVEAPAKEGYEEEETLSFEEKLEVILFLIQNL